MKLSPEYFNIKYIANVVILAVLYIITARIGLSLNAVSGFATLVWPPSAIGLTAIILFGYRLWPGIFAGAFIANYIQGASFFVATGIGFGNTLEALIGAYFLRRYCNPLRPFDQLGSILRFILYVALVSSAGAATIGTTSLLLGHVSSFENYSLTWFTWWIGDMLSILIIFPLLITWFPKGRPVIQKERILEGIVILISVISINLLVFISTYGQIHGAFLLYLVFLPLIWSTLRFGTAFTTIGVFITSLVATISTINDFGPFFILRSSVYEGLVHLQLFMGVTSITFLIFSSVMKERDQRMKESVQAVAVRNNFINIASHELKTPITSLKLNAELIQEKLIPKKSFEAISESVSQMNRQIDKMIVLIDDLLNISRIQSGKLGMRKEEFEIQKLVQEIIQEIQRSSPKHTITAEGRVSKKVFADRDRIGQVLTNFLTNAIKYSPSSNAVRVILSDEGDRVRVIVQDYGIGIPPEHLERIFDQFFRGNVDKKVFPGLGIGLYISKEIIEGHDGKIDVKSALGKGSEFSFTLPYSG